MGQGINFYPAKSEEFSEEVGVGFKTFLKRFPRAGGKKKKKKNRSDMSVTCTKCITHNLFVLPDRQFQFRTRLQIIFTSLQINNYEINN